MNIKSHYIYFIVALIVIFSGSINAFAGAVPRAGKSDLPGTFLKIWRAERTITLEKKSTHDNKITSLFVRPAGRGSIQMTMLIAYSRSIATAARNMLNEAITPLIFSVSALPLTSAVFNPEDLIFIQNERSWSPKMADSNSAMFPLGDKGNFGGVVDETQVHQGVILLPAWFELTKPITIQYQNFSKIALLVHNR